MQEPTMMLPDFGQNPLTFLKEVKAELAKVIWPKREEAIKMTLTVLVVSAAVGTYIGILDSILTRIFSKLIK